MNNRNIPFGYQYADGKVIVHTREADVLKEITEAYLSGQSLLRIAKELNDRAIEYTQGITGWNKARMMRILRTNGISAQRCSRSLWTTILMKQYKN